MAGMYRFDSRVYRFTMAKKSRKKKTAYKIETMAAIAVLSIFAVFYIIKEKVAAETGANAQPSA